ncbi:MAG: DUF4287 domain-containing protein [Acidobacteria bacterium]|nr:DUF4287 domain-containing protein [Acidobacteriota bacterium]
MPSPPPKPSAERAIRDEVVVAKTGKSRRAWFEQLDKAGARGWDHKAIARSLRQDYGLTPWWAQTVAVDYERAAGLRDQHEQPDGYQIQRERTVHVSAERAWRAWDDEAERLRWLPEAAQAKIRRLAGARRRVRLDWPNGRVLLGVQPRGDDKCSVGVMHSRLAGRDDAEAAKRFWSARLDALVALLEGPDEIR